MPEALSWRPGPGDSRSVNRLARRSKRSRLGLLSHGVTAGSGPNHHPASRCMRAVASSGQRLGGGHGFVQIMEFDTSKIDEVDSLSRKMQQERGDALLASKATITADRDRPGHYYVIGEFDSYDDAMKNSEDPVTSRYADEMAALLDGSPTFHNLDVVSVMNVR